MDQSESASGPSVAYFKRFQTRWKRVAELTEGRQLINSADHRELALNDENVALCSHGCTYVTKIRLMCIRSFIAETI